MPRLARMLGALIAAALAFGLAGPTAAAPTVAPPVAPPVAPTAALGAGPPPLLVVPVRPAASRLQSFAWSTLPDSPIRPRDGAIAVWTGHRMLVWGGGGRANGASFDPDHNSWRRLPVAPLAGRNDPAYVWTGSGLFVWGGSARNHTFHDGALYVPATRTWRKLPAAPVRRWSTAEAYLVAGKVVLLTTPPGRRWRAIRADVYDPATNRWHVLATLRLRPHRAAEYLAAVAGGDRLFVWSHWSYGTSTPSGGVIHNGVAGFTLHPHTGRWRHNRLAPQRLVDQPQWTGRRILLPTLTFWCYLCPIPLPFDTKGLAIDPRTGKRSVIPNGPVSDLEATWVWTGRELLGYDTRFERVGVRGKIQYPGAAAAWLPTRHRWVRLRHAPYSTDGAGVSVWTGSSLLIWGKLYNKNGHRVRPAGLRLGPVLQVAH